MNIRNIRIALLPIFALLAAAAMSSDALAAEATSTRSSAFPVSCPAYGQEIVKVSAAMPQGPYLAGSPLPLSIKLENKADYPLVGGSVLVRLVFESFADKAVTPLGSQIVERFFAAKDLSLNRGASKQLSLDLSLPEGAPSGSYSLAVSYVPSAALGMENPDADILESSGANMAVSKIDIKNGKPFTGMIAFDKKSFSIDKRTGTTTVSIALANSSTSTVAVPVSWKIYYWNAASDKTLIDASVESVSIAANGRKTISFAIKDTKHSSYEAVAEVESAGLSSSFYASVEGPASESSLRMMGVSGFPGKPAAFGCVSSTFANAPVADRVYLTATGDQGAVLSQSIFAVKPGYEFPFYVEFNAKGSGSVALAADLFAATGTAFERVSLRYDCAAFGSACVAETATSTATSTPAAEPLPTRWPYEWIVVLGAGIGGAFATLLALRRHHRRAPASAPVPPAPPTVPPAVPPMTPPNPAQ